MNKIAVIMSVYRADKLEYIKQSMDSILKQDNCEFEVLLYIDGYIPEDIEKYLSNIDAEMANVILFKSDSNNGLAYGMNKLIDYVVEKGCYAFVARMDSDDIAEPNRFEEQVAFFNSQQNVDVCGGYCSEFGASFAKSLKKVPLMHEELVKYSVIKCPFIHPTVMFKSNIFQEGNRYPTNTELTEDLALWFLLLEKGYKFANIDKVLLRYRLVEETLRRRRGFKKAISEVSLRLKFMLKMKLTSTRLIFLVLSRIFFNLLPVVLLKVVYRYVR
jgi:glycosyltransferase involved in cell wall biosynthesis